MKLKSKIEDFMWNHFVELSFTICMVTMVVIFATLSYIFPDFGPLQEYCFSYHMGTVENTSENSKVTYYKPTKICDVWTFKSHSGKHFTILGLYYGYDYQKKIGKPWAVAGLDCSPSTIGNLTYDNKTNHFICADGHYGKEFDYYKDEK